MFPSCVWPGPPIICLPAPTDWHAAVQRMEAAGYAPVSVYNRYWDEHGRTFEDPDGYRMVLQRAAWGL